MTNVIALASESRVDDAWDAYAAKARQIADDPALLSDRSFNEDLAKLHERWRRLFLMQEAG